MNNNINNNYQLTLDELASFQSQKSFCKDNENITNNINHAQPNIPQNVTINNNNIMIAEGKLHSFTRFRYSNELRKKYEDHLEKTNHSEKELNVALNKLRNMIYEYGLPDGSEVIIITIN